jgi:hypothetical protein
LRFEFSVLSSHPPSRRRKGEKEKRRKGEKELLKGGRVISSAPLPLPDSGGRFGNSKFEIPNSKSAP